MAGGAGLLLLIAGNVAAMNAGGFAVAGAALALAAIATGVVAAGRPNAGLNTMVTWAIVVGLLALVANVGITNWANEQMSEVEEIIDELDGFNINDYGPGYNYDYESGYGTGYDYTGDDYCYVGGEYIC